MSMFSSHTKSTSPLVDEHSGLIGYPPAKTASPRMMMQGLLMLATFLSLCFAEDCYRNGHRLEKMHETNLTFLQYRVSASHFKNTTCGLFIQH